MRAKTPRKTYAQQRCALTRHLRRRAQRAEAEVADLRRALARERRLRKADREAALAYIESPDWERDLLIIARDRVRRELLQLSETKQSCGTCGSFGRGFQGKFLQEAIEALTREHALSPAPALPDPDWPVHMGRVTKGGRSLDGRWLADEPVKRERRAERWAW